MVLELDTVNSNRTMYALKMSSDSNTTVPFTLSYTMDPLDRTIGIMYALVLLCALYVLIIFEVSYFLIQIIKESSRQARPDHTTAWLRSDFFDQKSIYERESFFGLFRLIELLSEAFSFGINKFIVVHTTIFIINSIGRWKSNGRLGILKVGNNVVVRPSKSQCRVIMCTMWLTAHFTDYQ